MVLYELRVRVFVRQRPDKQLGGSQCNKKKIQWHQKAFQHYFFTPSNNGQTERRLTPFHNTSFWQMGQGHRSVHVKKQQHVSQTSFRWLMAPSTSNQPTNLRIHRPTQTWGKSLHWFTFNFRETLRDEGDICCTFVKGDKYKPNSRQSVTPH